MVAVEHEASVVVGIVANLGVRPEVRGMFCDDLLRNSGFNIAVDEVAKARPVSQHDKIDTTALPWSQSFV